MSQVQVKFTTTHAEYAVPPAPILVPTQFKRAALSEIINHLLGKAEQDQVRFDFLIEGQLLRTSLDGYLAQNNLSTENVLTLEYVVALPPPTPVAAFQADDWISGVAIASPDRIVTAGYDGVLRLWNRQGETLAKTQLCTVPLKAIAVLDSTPDSMRVATAGMDKHVSVVEFGDSSAPNTLCTLVGHTDTIESIAHLPSQNQLFSASWDGTIKLFSTDPSSIATAQPPPPSKKRKGVVATAVSATVPQVHPLATLTGHVGAVTSVCVEGEHLYSGGYDHGVRVWDLSTHSTVMSMSCEKPVLSVAYSRAARLVASGHSDPAIRLWDPRAREATIVKTRLLGHRNQVAQVCWAPHSPFHLASASFDGSVRGFDTRAPGVALHTVAQPAKIAKPAPGDATKETVAKRLSVAWDHGLVASGGEEAMLNLWDAPAL